MNYKNAFKCHKCPRTNGELGCPMWWEFMTTEINTGQQELKKMCGYAALPTFLTEVIKASNRPAAAMEDMRNKLVQGFDGVAQVLENKTLMLENNNGDN